MEIHKYLSDVVSGELPVNHAIMYSLQDIFNLLPGLQQEETLQAFSNQTNDTMLVQYISSIIRSIVALHNLINNKRDLREAEDEKQKKKEEVNKQSENSSPTDPKKDATADSKKSDSKK